MKKNAFLLLFLSLVLFSCTDRNNSVVISGKISNANNKTLRLAMITAEGMDIIDSTKLRNGNFEFKISKNDERFSILQEAPVMFQLFLSEDNSLSTMAKEGEKLVISADASDLTKTYDISGGEEAELLHQLDSSLMKFIEPVDKLFEIYQKNVENDSVREQIESNYVVLLNKHREYLENFIDKHPYNMASYVAFYQSYNRREFFDPYQDLDILKKINSNMLEKYPNSGYVKAMVRVANMIEKNKNNLK